MKIFKSPSAWIEQCLKELKLLRKPTFKISDEGFD